jgi:hypothetical protein
MHFLGIEIFRATIGRAELMFALRFGGNRVVALPSSLSGQRSVPLAERVPNFLPIQGVARTVQTFLLRLKM